MALGDVCLLNGKCDDLQPGFFRDRAKVGGDARRGRAGREESLFELVTFFLHGRDTITDAPRSLDVSLQDLKLQPARSQLPAIEGQAEIRRDQQSHSGKDDAAPHCKILSHQVLEYSAFNSTITWSPGAPCVGRLSPSNLMPAKLFEPSRAFRNLILASSLDAPTVNLTSARPFSCFGSMLTTRTPGGRIFSRSINICVQSKLRASIRLLRKAARSWSLAFSSRAKKRSRVLRCWASSVNSCCICKLSARILASARRAP